MSDVEKEDHQKQIGSTADAKPQCDNTNVSKCKILRRNKREMSENN
jgi:hypothetical protein